MKRLFVAVDFPEAIKAQLKPLCSGLSGAKWVAHYQMHLTLRFIGDADKQQEEAIKTGLAGMQATPFSVSLQGIGQFPPKGKPRVIWVGVQAEAALNQLQAKVEQAVRNCGFEEADHPFSPHITLARFREAPNGEQVERYFAHHQHFETEVFPVDRFVLYSSQLTPSGSIYTPEGIYRLS
jgi:2'-5' RNA ligase